MNINRINENAHYKFDFLIFFLDFIELLISLEKRTVSREE